VTGWNTNLFELMKAAERGTMLARAFNSLEGFTIRDDQLPKRLFDPKPSGPNAGENLHGKGFSKRIEMFCRGDQFVI
jgi:aldehyde:ferredoxin oxidoreductase